MSAIQTKCSQESRSYSEQEHRRWVIAKVSRLLKLGLYNEQGRSADTGSTRSGEARVKGERQTIMNNNCFTFILCIKFLSSEHSLPHLTEIMAYWRTGLSGGGAVLWLSTVSPGRGISDRCFHEREPVSVCICRWAPHTRMHMCTHIAHPCQ